MASGDVVQQIKDRLSIVDVVAPYVELHKAGKNFKGKSPFTNEKTPSFYVSPDRGMYYCFSSSQGGDIFTFVQAMEGVDFKGALKILADKAGVEVVPEDPQKRTERDRQYDILEEATKFFEKRLTEEMSAREYLERRGVAAETRARWRIGYAPGPPSHGWRELKAHLEEKGYSKEEMVRAGLIKGLDTGKEPYDLFRDRIMFPIMDASGRVVAYSGRILTPDTESPKYVNSPETELFVKSDVLFGYDKAKEGIRKLNFALIVEGQFDVVLSHQAGYSNTVAVSGTALTPHHVELLQRLSNRVVLALDDDRAGIAAVKRAADLMLARSMDVKVAKMEGGKDPADMVLADPHKFKEAIKNSHHVIEYLLTVLHDEAKEERTYKLRVKEEILPYVAKIPNAIDREHFENVIAERIGTTKDAIHIEVQKILSKTPAPFAAEPPREIVTVDASEQLASYAEQIFGAVRFLERFEEGVHVSKNLETKIKEVLCEQYDAFYASMNDDRLNKVLMQFEKTYESFPSKAFFENLVAKLNRFHQIHLRQQLQAQSQLMRMLEQSGELLEEYAKAQNEAVLISEKLKIYHISEDEILLKKD
jgi:DNA primase